MIVDVIRCKHCKRRGTDECPMYHIELVEYDNDGYLDLQDIIYDYTEDDGYCDRGKKEWKNSCLLVGKMGMWCF